MEQKQGIEIEVKKDGRSTRTDFYSKYEFYEPTKEFKDFFLKRCEQELNEHRYNTMKNLMRKLGKWERKYGKDAFDFTLEQLKGMLKEFNSTSEMSLMSQKSNLEYYLLFAKSQSMGNLNVPSSIELNYVEIKEFVNPIGAEQKYVTRNEMYDLVEPNYDEDNKIVSGLVNYVDQAMPLLIFEGFMGKANEDLCNLKWREIDFEKCIINYKGKTTKITTELADILEAANNQEIYLLNNGKSLEENKEKEEAGEVIRNKRPQAIILDKHESEYLLRPLDYKNEDGEGKLTGGAIQRRVLTNCKVWLNKPYLTLNSIYVSGLVDRGIRHTYEAFGGELMRNADWQRWIKATGEKVNLQDSYALYKEMFAKQEQGE
jgi:integrase